MIAVGPDGTARFEDITGKDGHRVTIEREVEHVAFEQALMFVVDHLPHLITPPLTHICLCKEIDGAAGLYRHHWGSEYATIDVAVSRQGVEDYIDTIVHELTHLQQHRSGRILQLWTQSICSACYERVQPGRDPVKMIFPEPEKCCACGRVTLSGVYYRIDPATVAFPTRTK